MNIKYKLKKTKQITFSTKPHQEIWNVCASARGGSDIEIRVSASMLSEGEEDLECLHQCERRK